MYNKVGAVGDKDTVLAFQAIGVDVFCANSPVEARELIKKMDKSGYAVIFLTEDLVPPLSDLLARYKTRPYPAVIPIPQGKGPTGLGMEGLKADMEKAVGADILFQEQQTGRERQ